MSKYDKAAKSLGPDTVTEIEALDTDGLRKRIVEANDSMRKADDELEANVEYQSLRESVKAVTAGRSEVFKRQKAVITVALTLLNNEVK